MKTALLHTGVPALLLTVLWTASCCAIENSACYTPAELNRVRLWEETWTATSIDADTVTAVRDLLPPSYYACMRAPDTWGDAWFEIVRYRPIAPTPGQTRQTAANEDTARLNADGSLDGWQAGIPFPHARTALKIMHNFKHRNNGDGIENRNQGDLVDGRLGYAMHARSCNRYCYWSGRFDTPPVPAITPNRRGIWRSALNEQFEPAEQRNFITLELQYSDEMKPYDSWTWNSRMRRVVRRSTSAREDSSGGNDFCDYDSMGYDGPIQINRYRLLKTAEYLMARHTDPSQLERHADACLWSGSQRERCKMYVVEAENNDPQFIYGRQVWYVDPETWQMLYAERYDREGRLWRALDQLCSVIPGWNNVPVAMYTAIQSLDLQTVHSTMLCSQMRLGVQFRTRLFSPGNLQKRGY